MRTLIELLDEAVVYGNARGPWNEDEERRFRAQLLQHVRRQRGHSTQDIPDGPGDAASFQGVLSYAIPLLKQRQFEGHELHRLLAAYPPEVKEDPLPEYATVEPETYDWPLSLTVLAVIMIVLCFFIPSKKATSSPHTQSPDAVQTTNTTSNDILSKKPRP